MTPCACRYLRMFWMTIGTQHGGVFCHFPLQHILDVFVTTGANGRLCGLAIGHFQGFVNRMAHLARFGIHVYGWAMGFVASVALGDIAMLVRVTIVTTDF